MHIGLYDNIWLQPENKNVDNMGFFSQWCSKRKFQSVSFTAEVNDTTFPGPF